jgi:hypothetical protein
MSYSGAIAQLKNSVSRPSLYKIVMPSRFIGRDTNDYLEYFCNTAQVPSVRYEGINVTGHSLMGITRIQPTMPIWTNPLTVTVIENSDFTVYEDFKGWFDETGQGIDQSGSRNIRLSYYDQIVGDIELIKLENPNSLSGGGNGGANYKEVLTVKFLNSYIKSIGPVSLDSSSQNSFLQFQIEFNYESYTTEFS